MGGERGEMAGSDLRAGSERAAIRAQARLHHAYLLGLQLMIATRIGPDVMEEWMFRLFRRQHLDKFLSSFEKLGLVGLPDAVACARYHVLSNSIGGAPVEYMEEGPKKAWVRFRYPRWMYDGPTICGIPLGVSRGFLRGWYAHNGVSLGNPRLRFVCVSEDMTGEFGLCGYFEEGACEVGEDERLVFAKDERPPPFDAAAQPRPPSNEWSEERLARANRNYAVDYVRNGLIELAGVIGESEVLDKGRLAARLIGLQYYRETAALVGARDGGVAEATEYLSRMLGGMGDRVDIRPVDGRDERFLEHRDLRIVRGLEDDERSLLLSIWTTIFTGAASAHRDLPTISARPSGDFMLWHIHV